MAQMNSEHLPNHPVTTLRSSRGTSDGLRMIPTGDPIRSRAQRMRDETTQRLVVGGKCTVNFMVNFWLTNG